MASSELAPVGPCPSDVGPQKWRQHLQVGSHLSRTEGQNPPSLTALAVGSSQYMGASGLSVHIVNPVELLIYQHSQILFPRAAPCSFFAQPMFVLGIALTHMQDLGLGLVELRKVHTDPLLQPVQIPLEAIPFPLHSRHTTQVW